MAWFRSKQARAIDGFGPGDTLLASVGTLKQGTSQELVRRIIFDDEFNSRAHALARDLGDVAAAAMVNICSEVLESGTRAAKGSEAAREAFILSYVPKLLLQCRQLLGIESIEQAGDPESLIILTTLRGTSRMLELRRRDQAEEVLVYGMCLALCLTSQQHVASSGGQIATNIVSHHADWDTNGCTLRLTSGSPSWRFDHEPDKYFDDLYAEAALAQLQVAYKQPVSFPNSEQRLLDVFTVPFRATGEAIPDGLALNLDWSPPLPTN